MVDHFLARFCYVRVLHCYVFVGFVDDCQISFLAAGFSLYFGRREPQYFTNIVVARGVYGVTINS